MGTDDKIVEIDELVEIREGLRDDELTVVQCHGCFDIVHPGHIRHLRYAKSVGDILIISVTADPHIDKGYDRPYIHQDLRMENLAALEFVDYVTLAPDAEAKAALEKIRPDIYIKGKEYETNKDPRFRREKEIVESHGGKVLFSSGDVVFSSTRILEGLRQQLPMDQEKTQFFCDTYDVSTGRIDEAIDSFEGAKVLVVGDAILDLYQHCEEMQVASEGPVPSVAPIEKEWFAGGAGLIAGQLSEFGADVTMLTTLDESAEADQFTEMLGEKGVSVESVETELRGVFVKSRYLVQDRKVFKVNLGQRSPLPADLVDTFADRLGELMADADIMIVTDFGYGMFGPSLVEKIDEAWEEHETPYILDVSRSGSSNLLRFKHPRIAVPTEDEIRFAFGDLDAGLSHLASNYYKQTEAERLILTLGPRGALLFSRTERPDEHLLADYLPSFLKHPIDTVGAGDVFLSALTLAEVVGESPQLGLYMGSSLAAVHISHLGNAPVGLGEYRQFLNERLELRV